MELFRANKIITEHVAETKLSIYLVGVDLNDNGDWLYRLNSLIKILIKTIPEFLIGYFGNSKMVLQMDIMDVAIDSAKAMYKIDVFQKVRDIYGKRNEIEDFFF